MGFHRYNAERQAAAFNRKYPVGTAVRYTSADWRGGDVAIVASPATVVGSTSHTRFEGVRGYWHTKFVEPLKPKRKRTPHKETLAESWELR